MKRSTPLFIVFVAVLLLLGSVAPASPSPSRPPTPEQQLDRLIRHLRASPATPQRIVLNHFRLVGHSDLGADIDFGDVYGHGNYAYVGSRCGDHLQGGGGVRVVDISNPGSPQVVSTLANPTYTRAEDLTVLDVQAPTFTGALAVVGIQACIGSGHDIVPGLRLFDF